MHRIKGLELPNIIIVGANEGVLPLERPIDDSIRLDIELRERCLLHVAANRARDRLVVTSYGKPSRFLI